jgi:hypothetical protein
MRKTTTILALAALLGAGAQAAFAHEMEVIQGGENFEVRWTGGPRDNMAGGGTARLLGGGQDSTLVYEPATLSGQRAQAQISGGGDDMTITHTAPDAPASMLAQGATQRRR